jgi:raffinose/stachyose/melibiose transport system substrate-binding protein
MLPENPMEGVLKKSVLVAAVAAIGLATAALTGCSGGGNSGGDAKSITMWHNTADSPAILDLYKAFTKKTGIKINLVGIPASSFESTVTTKWATGDRPDVLEYHPTLSKILTLQASNFVPLDGLPFIKKSGDLYSQAGSANGHVYAAITGFPSIFGLYFNKADLDKAGIKPPQNWADLTAACKALKAVGITPLYESGSSQWPTQILPYMYMADQNEQGKLGDAFFENKTKLNDPKGPFVEALTAYKDLQKEGCFQPDVATGTFEKATAAVLDGSAAMTALHSDAYTQFLTSANNDAQKVTDNVGFVGVSKDKPVAWFSPGPLGSYYEVKTGKASNEAAARKFIEFATGDGYAAYIKEAKTFPIISGVPAPAGLNPLQQSYKAVYDKGATFGVTNNLPGWDSITTEIGKLLNDQATPQQVADSMEAALTQAAKAAKLKGW